MKIYKYMLEITDEQKVKVPFPFHVLSVKLQHDAPVLYVSVDDKSLTTTLINVKIFGTGHDLDLGQMSAYIGTFETLSGFVGHVFIDHGDMPKYVP